MQVPARLGEMEEERGWILGSSCCWSSLHREEQGLPELGSHCPENTPSPVPYLGKRKLLYLFCVGKSSFFTTDRAPVTGSPLTLELHWKDKHGSFPEQNKVPP